MMAALPSGTYPAFFDTYVRLVDAASVREATLKYKAEIVAFFQTKIPTEKISFRYAEGKWNLKEVLQHVIDTERIFAYRILRISRGDKTPLPGFDEKAFAAESEADLRTWESLLEEFEAVRKSTDLLLQSLSEEQLNQTGTTNGNPVTAKAIGFIVYGHILHHINIVKQRYLQ
jgi:uncharacterized damage-inducible protein DinB